VKRAQAQATGVIDVHRLLALVIPARRHSYTERDSILYALGVGFGSDPMDRDELRFVYEEGLKAVPTQATTIAWDRSWVPASGIDWAKVVHGEQLIIMGQALRPSGDIISTARVLEVLDKGTGALVRVETRLQDALTQAWLCTATTSFFVRGAAGVGAAVRKTRRHPSPPDSLPDATHEVQTFGHQALLYRLSGDRNPHHASPVAAQAGGFARPVLHGLCTYGLACRSVLRAFCNFEPARIASFGARFSAPVFPGDTLRFDMWKDGNDVTLRGHCPQRGSMVIEASAVLREDAPDPYSQEREPAASSEKPATFL
jgi:acyl dehydratase